MIVAAAFCPAPPLLHPQVLGSAGRDVVAALRGACAEALDRILATEPDAVLVLGGSSVPAVYGPGDSGDLIGYGVPVRLGFDGPAKDGAARLPLPHTFGAWLLDEAGFTGQRLGITAGPESPELQSASVDGRRWAMLVMGDGSARRTEKSPGWYDPDAVDFDGRVTAALAAGDGKALLDLDETVGVRVLAAGLTSWNTAGAILQGTPMVATLHYADDPFGVFYVVASWVEADKL